MSTDYVFDGKATTPYREDAPVGALGVYGATKAEGERRVLDAGGVVVRTSWLFEQDGPSFVHTMLRLAKERDVLRIVNDQVGCPTWADDLATALLSLAALGRRKQLESTYHFCDAGVVTWFGFANAIVEEARSRGAELACQRIEPIMTADYPLPAQRPAFSALDTTRIRGLGISTPTWKIGLAHVVSRVLG
jgi:dTDP-4-dehydrorhamnose reductase